MNNVKIFLFVLLGFITVVCLSTTGFLMIKQTKADQTSEKVLEFIRASAEAESEPAADHPGSLQEDNTSESPLSPENEPETEPASEPQPEPVENPYREGFLANEDMAAWLKIEDTVIDYPVMWTPQDEIYYLYRDFEKKDNPNGCLILDTDSSLEPLTTNLIIHGHNMRSGAMFGTLAKYKDQDYCESHRYITLHTKDRERRYEVLAVFRSQVFLKTDTVFKFYKFFQADTEEEFDDFYQNIKTMSLYDTGVTASFGDHFITLSTCSYHVEQGRFVVVGKEIESGDIYAPLGDQKSIN